MRNGRVLFLTGIGIALGGPAVAADLPVKAAAVEYVKLCSAYGAGYAYVPGTDTCLRMGGYARFDTYVNAVGTFNPAISSVAASMFTAPGGGVAGYPLETAKSPDHLTRARAVLDLDARTATDYGVLRSFTRFGVQWDSAASAGSPAGSALYFERAFVQFSGFTFGYTQSFFDAGVQYMFTQPYAGSNTWTSLIGYTLQLGNGLSATLALEDAVNRTTGVQFGAAVGTFTGGTQFVGLNGLRYTNLEDGLQAPDLVANVRLDQVWGTVMASGALHQVGGMIPAGFGNTQYVGEASDTSWGWAAGASAEIKLPMLAPGDSLYLQANYADGALNYLGLSGNYQQRATGLGSIGLTGAPATAAGGFYPIADAIWTGTGYAKESGWAVQAQFRHYWLTNLRSAIYAGYVKVEVPANASFTAANIARLPGAALFNAGYSVDVLQLGANTVWSPVRNLDIGVELLYSRVDGTLPATAGIIAGTSSAGTLAVFGGSVDVWSSGLRAQRNF